ncbi:S-formylglutathione hydrolase [Bacillus sp. DTU_2020_1000418_1_SI_GHA_SEK_038]|uniref:S-formylglutathione hydrolase n=1 Tax=Bacillus sp. DTU_2020_1000418_1_SI_GHA_SEK_038 TaxID=3077585 RepID=UPI0028ED321E|nr:S-formylglutathione hydrolase [Bacillus sp. DTU_2020_1000418_1_SI_GHA_SEK_038]WNS76798.1 S-formylglutathione hydrolase [Bacillus sp. DTU_2020_1000418_1_SI_GHA_SEK_038]
MSLKIIEKHRSFGGEHFKYSHYSEVLQCDMTFSLYLPSNIDNKKIPLIWWLSGLTCTDDNFSHKSGFQRLAEKYQTAVMIPDTSPRGEHVANDEGYDLGHGAGFYVNATQEPWAKHYKMYSYIVDELTAIATSLVPHFSGEESIMGHSMGGHGALVIGLKNTERFKAISAFSPILSPSQVPWGIKAFSAYLGDDQAAWKEWDASELVKEASIPPILIMQGSQDDFYPVQLEETAFIQNAREHNQVVQYEKLEGYDHSYYFIATFLEDHFAFHKKHFR